MRLTPSERAAVRQVVREHIVDDIARVLLWNVMPVATLLFLRPYTDTLPTLAFVIWAIVSSIALASQTFDIGKHEIPDHLQTSQMPDEIITPSRAAISVACQLLIVLAARFLLFS